MAKSGSKTVVEKISEGVDKILHPEKPEQETQAEKESKPKSAYKSEMGKHKKFDKFN